MKLPLGARINRDERCTYGTCESHRYFESRTFCYWHWKVDAGLATAHRGNVTVGPKTNYINPNTEQRPAGERTRANQRWVKGAGG